MRELLKLRKKIIEYFQQRSFLKYCKKQTIITDEYMKNKKLIIGDRYEGEYFLNGKLHRGYLLEVFVSSDGPFAILREDNGKEIQDIKADSLIKL